MNICVQRSVFSVQNKNIVKQYKLTLLTKKPEDLACG